MNFSHNLSPSMVTRRYLFGALAIFAGSFLATAFASHSLTPVYDGSALGDYAANPYATLSFAVSDPSDAAAESVNFSASPGTLATKTVNLLAATDNETGYTLSFSDADEDTALHLDGDATSAFTIPSITAATADRTDITTNTYGYAFGSDAAFSPIPALSTPVALVATNTYNANNDGTPSPFNVSSGLVSDSYDFTLGTKVDMSMATGVYQNTLVFTLVANQLPVRYLQDLTAEACQALTLEQQYLFYDKRDEKDYTIARLKDGNCWMTSNLRLGNAEGGASITLTSEDTNLQTGEEFVLPASAGGVWAESNNNQNTTDTKHLYSNGNLWLDDDYTSESQAPGNFKATGLPASPSQYVGNYYNWYTATAGTGLYNNTIVDAQSSICPKGWRLPTYSYSEPQQLFAQYISNMSADTSNLNDSIIIRSFPMNLHPIGSYNALTGSPEIGWGAGFWSSTPRALYASHAQLYGIRVVNVDPVGYNQKIRGVSIRCLLETRTLTDIEYLQDITSQICENTGTEITAILKDKRDDKEYTVAKLKDDRCWMTSNLRLGGTSALTLTDTLTDLADNTSFTLPASAGGVWTQPASGTGGYDDPNMVAIPHMYSNGNNWIDDNLSANTQEANIKTSGTPSSPAQYIGNYYNLHTATSGSTLDEGNAPYSICPKNWKLPTSSSTDGDTEYAKLAVAYDLTGSVTGSIIARSSPLNFQLSGGYINNRVSYQGYRAYYYASSRVEGKYAQVAYIGIDQISDFINAGWPTYGRSIRCIAR